MCSNCDSREALVGERVLAVSDVDTQNNTIKIFGTGVYEGQHVPHWVDLDLLISTIPDELKEVAQKAVEELLERFADPTAPQRISNTALGMGMSPKKAAEMLDSYFEDQKKYAGMTTEQAATEYLKDLVAKEMQSARIRLDSGEFVYGTHCIFGKEKEMQDAIDKTVAGLAQKGILVKIEEAPVPEHADA